MTRFWGMVAVLFGSVAVFMGAVYMMIFLWEFIWMFVRDFWIIFQKYGHAPFSISDEYRFPFTSSKKWLWIPLTAFPFYLVFLFASMMHDKR